MKKTFPSLLTTLALTTLLLASCGLSGNRSTSGVDDLSGTQAGSAELKIVASFYPIAEFASRVVGDKGTVTTITPPGAEPHDFEPTAQQVSGIYQSSLFIYNGAGLDPWADNVSSDLQSNNVSVVKMATYMPSIASIVDEATMSNSTSPTLTTGTGSTQSTSSADPHFWLSPALAQKEVEIIRDAVIKIDPADAAYFNKNADDYIKSLQELDLNFKTGLSNCKSKDIFTSHAAFGYLAKEYGLTQNAIAGISPEQEPSAKYLAELTDLAKQKGIKYIYFETLVSPKLAETLANEVGAKTLPLNPIESLTSDQISASENYITVMRANLANLQTGLDCAL